LRLGLNGMAESLAQVVCRIQDAPRDNLKEGIDVPGALRAQTHGTRMTIPARRKAIPENGLTLIELIVTVSILTILASAAVPITMFEVQRQKEALLRYDLQQMRDAIDAYRNAADRGAFQIKIDTQGYPPDLDTLVSGVEVQSKKLQFLKKIPVDPMTGKAEWGMRSMQDDPTSTSWGGQNVFDVYSESDHVGLNGRKYSDW